MQGTPLDLFHQRLPKIAYAMDQLGPMRLLPKAEAILRRYIQTQPKNVVGALPFDIDRKYGVGRGHGRLRASARRRNELRIRGLGAWSRCLAPRGWRLGIASKRGGFRDGSSWTEQERHAQDATCPVEGVAMGRRVRSDRDRAFGHGPFRCPLSSDVT